LIAWPLLIASLPVGAVIGSYAATLAVRAGEGRGACFGRSRCDHCGVALGFADTAPVVSYFARGGACAHCGGRIDALHPVGEILGGLVLVSAIWAGVDLVEAALLGALGLTLTALSLIDCRTLRLPDALTVAAAVLGAVLAWRRSPEDLWIGAAAATATALILTLLRATLRRRLGREALGQGDVKLIAALALWLGLNTSWAVVAAALAGLAGLAWLKPKDGRIPFGPAIAAGGWCVGLWTEVSTWRLP